ncbi:MAG TPA: PAS domain-containing protein [Lentimicrobium sp.]|nr:PAS domain-containing protein [Lentimicrobium sp.]
MEKTTEKASNVTGTQNGIKDIIYDQAEINADLGTFYWNLDTLELYYSDNFYRLLGCKPGEFKPDVDYFNSRFIHPDDKERIELEKTKTLSNKLADAWEYRIITKSGEIKHVRATSKVINRANHHVLVGTIQDVTKELYKLQQLQKRQEELRIANIELKTSLKVIQNAEISAGLGHWHINLDTNEFNFSENLQKISGYTSKDEITFETVLSLLHPDDRHNLIETSLKDYQMKRTSVSVFRIIRKDGRIRYIKGTSDKMRINRATFIVGIAQDITSLIDKEIMLEEKNLQLERQNDELASFNHMASHDLQEPLRKIMVLSKLIMENEDGNLSETSLNYFNRMLQSALRMQTLINDLLDYSRASNLSSIKIPYDLNRALKETLHNLKEEISIKKAKIEAEPLPVLNAVPGQIQQLFNNLIDNALKYSKSDVTPIIKISSKIVPGEQLTGFGLKKIAHYYCISFSDNGIGFDQKYANKIFELFQRLHSKTEYSGTGIGLTICKKVVQNHNGYITASGSPNEGSIFNLFFPVEKEEDVEFM